MGIEPDNLEVGIPGSEAADDRDIYGASSTEVKDSFRGLPAKIVEGRFEDDHVSRELPYRDVRHGLAASVGRQPVNRYVW